jgi:hypothetical protein
MNYSGQVFNLAVWFHASLCYVPACFCAFFCSVLIVWPLCYICLWCWGHDRWTNTTLMTTLWSPKQIQKLLLTDKLTNKNFILIHPNHIPEMYTKSRFYPKKIPHNDHRGLNKCRQSLSLGFLSDFQENCFWSNFPFEWQLFYWQLFEHWN